MKPEPSYKEELSLLMAEYQERPGGSSESSSAVPVLMDRLASLMAAENLNSLSAETCRSSGVAAAFFAVQLIDDEGLALWDYIFSLAEKVRLRELAAGTQALLSQQASLHSDPLEN